MKYLANPTTGTREAMDAGIIGCMATPAQGNRIQPEWTWAADNGCFSDSWSPGKWLTFLEKHDPFTCLFAVVPDKVADPVETARRWHIWAPVVREIGPYPLAYVLQDGATFLPWNEFDCLFIGGSTEYKLSETAQNYAQTARREGKWVHWGRVNSRSRFAGLALTGDSCDGTYLTFGPDINLPKLKSWLNTLPWTAS